MRKELAVGPVSIALARVVAPAGRPVTRTRRRPRPAANPGLSQAPIRNSVQTEERRMEAYCFKCRSKQEIANPEQVYLKNGRPASRGTCPVCGTRVFRIGKVS